MSEREAAFLDLELSVEVWLASERVPLGRLLDLEPGGVMPLSHDPDGPVDLVVNGATVATGELVVIDGKFGFRVGTPSAAGIEAAAASIPAAPSAVEGQSASPTETGEAAEAAEVPRPVKADKAQETPT